MGSQGSFISVRHKTYLIYLLMQNLHINTHLTKKNKRTLKKNNHRRELQNCMQHLARHTGPLLGIYFPYSNVNDKRAVDGTVGVQIRTV